MNASATATLDPAATHEELAALFQSSENYYLANWPSGQSPNRFFGRFNWAAFFFGATWLLYRRLWKGAAVYYLATIILGATLSGSSWFFLCILICRLAVGSGANFYYFSKIQGILVAVRKESLGPAQHLERLKALGGTSETAVVIAISVNVILSLVVALLGASEGAA
jgi:hypothetical protein